MTRLVLKGCVVVGVSRIFTFHYKPQSSVVVMGMLFSKTLCQCHENAGQLLSIAGRITSGEMRDGLAEYGTY